MKFTYSKTLQGAKKTARHISLLVLNLFLIAFTACQDYEGDSPGSGDELSIDFKTGSTTRSGMGQIFEAGDSIGIYSVKWMDSQTPGSLLASGNRQDNIPYWMGDDNTTWQADQKIIYPLGGENIDLYSYYPFAQEPMNPDATVKVAVEADQSTTDSYKKSDFKAAVTRELNRHSGPFTFEFYHRLSQIQFELTAGDDTMVDDLLSAEIKLKNVIKDGSYSFTGGAPDQVTPGTTITDIIPCGGWVIEDNKVTGKVGIIIPQTLSGSSILEVTVGDNVFTSDFSNAVTFNSGESTLLAISINGESIDFTAEVKPWNEQPPADINQAFFTMEVDCNTYNTTKFTFSTDIGPDTVSIDWGDGQIENHILTDGGVFTHSYDTTNKNIFKITVAGNKSMGVFRMENGGIMASATNTLTFNNYPRLSSVRMAGFLSKFVLNNCPYGVNLEYFGSQNNKKEINLISKNEFRGLMLYNVKNIKPTVNLNDFSRISSFQLSYSEQREIDISGLNLLVFLTLHDCPYLDFSSIDISKYQNLSHLIVQNSLIEEADLSSNPRISRIYCRNTPLSNNPEAVIRLANSLPDRSNLTRGDLSIGPNVDLIKNICASKNWNAY